MRLKVGLKTIAQMDLGKIEAAFDGHIKRAAADCMDRPGDRSARKVALIVTLRPGKEQAPTGDYVDMECDIKSTIPAHKSRTFSARGKVGGHIEVEEFSPNDPNQGGLEFSGRDGEGA